MKYFKKVILLICIALATVDLIAQHGWTVNPNKYPNSGEVVAIVYLGPDLVTNGTLGAFVGDTCRGLADGIVFPPTGKTVFIVMCYSYESSGETLTFKYYDPLSDSIYIVNETVPFVKEMTVGNAMTPQEFHVTLNNPPVLASIGNKTVCQYNELTFIASASDPDPTDVLTFSLVGAPTGASINSSTGAFTWTPDSPGSYTFTVKVTDNGTPVLSDEEQITVTVNALPVITITGPATACAESTGNVYTTEASMAGYNWIVSLGGTITAGGTGSSNTVTVTWSTTGAQTVSVNYTNSNGCTAETAKVYNVTVNANVTPAFTQLGPYCVGATPGTLPATSTNGITGTWSPATVSTASAGSTVYTFTPTAGLCATTTTMTVVVNVNILPAFTQLGPYCVGATPGTLPATSTNGITGTWSPATVSTASAGSTVYTFTPTAGLCATTTTMTVVVNVNILPAFTQLGPYCVGATPGTLPATSTNGITGTWSPATVSTASAGSTVYTFTPTAGLCATTTTMTVVVNVNILPAFTQLGPYCVGATPGTLPATSTNGITGTWSPATVSTASAGSTVYTFTPTAGLCATTTTMTVVVNVNILPAFTQLGPYCVGATPGTLPATSTNGITGTWSPATVSTASAGSTVYTFTPTAGLCATTTTMTVVVNALPTITLSSGPTCAPDLLTYSLEVTVSTGTVTSNNGTVTSLGSNVWSITGVPTGTDIVVTVTDGNSCVNNIGVGHPDCSCPGILAPVSGGNKSYCAGGVIPTISATVQAGETVDWYSVETGGTALLSGSLTYLPLAAGTYYAAARNIASGCVSSSRTAITITVNANVTPAFTQLGPYCVGATPGTLPATSTNGITGTWSPATVSTASAGSTVYTFTPTAGLCATTTTMTVVVNVNILPAFTQLGPYCVGATPGTLPATSTNGITGTWSPATVSTASAGSTVYTFTPTAGLCATTTTMTVVVNVNILPAFTQLGPYCVGATPGTLPATSTNGITGTWSPATVSTASAGSTVYTFTPTAGLCATTTTMTVVVNVNILPAFTQLGPYCVGATPGTLPATSTNGITGTWSPATVSTASAGSTVYTFTPTAGLCATTTTMTVVVNVNILPAFTQLGPYCVGATPGTLPATSTNGITGTWSPATVSTASAGSTVYTFTPTAGLCATTTTMTVVVNVNILPAFTQLGPYCVGATPGTLPATSTNGITGTWSPATVSTASAGSTVYTFTPTAGLCATTTTMTVVVNVNILPAFTQLGPYCVGATPGTLPATSTNGITGTWSPATVSTASAGSTVYTFTPTAGLCATTTTMTVVVNVNILPAFTQLGPYCVGATPGTLPATSTNGITGTWSPATVSTASAGSTVYTFTPTAGLCATTTTMTVVVNVNILPAFTQLGPYCVGATPGTLPATSTNGITGTWSPATVSTASAGSTVYTFTPTAGLCATTTTMTVVVNVNILPAFTQLGPYCVGATPGTLPATSTNGITGTWSPATVSTASAGSTVYTFTPTAGLCATTTTMTVVVNVNILPAFTQLGPYCVGATPGTLPATSTNGITGTWSPATVSTASAGSTVYTFTPTAGLCATTTTMTVVVNVNILPAFTQLGPYCVGATPGTLPATSTNGITGTWSPATVSTASAGSTVYTFTPTAGLCATTTTMTVVVNTLPIPTISGNTTACAGSTGNAYTTEAGMTGYAWTVSAGGTITAGTGTNAITVTWNTAGPQTVQVNYTNANGCTATTAKVYNVTVNALPVTSSITGNATPACSGTGDI